MKNLIHTIIFMFGLSVLGQSFILKKTINNYILQPGVLLEQLVTTGHIKSTKIKQKL